MIARLLAFARGLRHAWIPVALALLAHVPGRLVYAENEALHGRPGWQFFAAGLLGDLRWVGPVVLLAFVVPLGGALFFRASARAKRWSAVVVTSAAAAVLVAAWVFSVAAIECKLERGLYPTYFETKLALGSTSFVVGSLPTLLLDRYWKTSLLVIVAVAGVLAAYWRWARHELSSVGRVCGFVSGALVLLLAGHQLFVRDRIFFPRTGGSTETRSPIETVLLGKFPWPDHAPLTDGMRQLFASRTYDAKQKEDGLRALGYPASSLDRLIAFETNEPCSAPHPLARPLDRAFEGNARASATMADLEALSIALFEGRSEPITVWQIAMESFRADDVAALQPTAPPELTPVMNRLYRSERAIGFTRVFQGGFRTAHNVSSLLCGVGSLPFSIAAARDLGHVPLRCLPDVLSDAGLSPRVFFSSDLAYDNMLDFLRYHGVDAVGGPDMPEGLPVGSWGGVSDRALYDQALARASRDRSEYAFILTLSGHSPFRRPTDMPPEVEARAAQACAKKSKAANADDCRRLAVMAYADHALGEMLDKLERSPLGKRSIVVVSADHATSELLLWPGSIEARARAHVPYVIVLPEALVASAAHPERVPEILARLRAHDDVLSLADSPSLVMSLLSATAQVERIPPEWRFHTFGGQATSPHFSLPARPEARVWGTDSASFVFSVDDALAITVDDARNRTFSDVSEFDTMNATLRGPAAFLSSFVKGYLLRCEGEAHLRMSARSAGRVR
ncbi:MAG: LTA synthase family protein [Labilithrix sp.]|nr:LTA synthase family protein [Labilithrix sp.]